MQMIAHSPEAVGAQAAGLFVGLPTIRQLRSNDRSLVDALVRELSPLSRLRRFHWPLREASPTLLDRLVNQSGPDDAALLAVLPANGGEVAVGEARFAADSDRHDAHEFALVVVDPWQRIGVGRRLMRELMQLAARSGVKRLYGDTFADNVPMLELARSLGFERRRHPTDARLVRVSSTLENWKDNMNTQSNVLHFPRRASERTTQAQQLWSLVRDIVERWLQRARDRRDLAHLSEWQRRDMGLPLNEIEREANKPFWRA
jgi:GNAT superfamily N-acetyltransferase/uncharacterized protein YjiS (DUF1127 family)